MYRKPLLTTDDIDALIGKIVRLEWSETEVGTVTGRTDGYILFRRPDGVRDDLLCIPGAWVVFATTIDSFIPPEDESPFVPVLWRERDQLL